nr:MAG TPA: hypothetical protein [Caudoviricetes sp.]
MVEVQNQKLKFRKNRLALLYFSTPLIFLQ